MSICLVVQKDTLENNKVKTILKTIENDPHEFVAALQENHCIEYQLLAYVLNSSNISNDTETRLISLTTPYKTNYGKDWYEFDHNLLAQIISLFIENEVAIINFKLIANIMGFSFNIFPIITKEIHVSPISPDSENIVDEDSKDNVISTLEQLQSEFSKKKRDPSKTKKQSKK